MSRSDSDAAAGQLLDRPLLLLDLRKAQEHLQVHDPEKLHNRCLESGVVDEFRQPVDHRQLDLHVDVCHSSGPGSQPADFVTVPLHVRRRVREVTEVHECDEAKFANWDVVPFGANAMYHLYLIAVSVLMTTACMRGRKVVMYDLR